MWTWPESRRFQAHIVQVKTCKTHTLSLSHSFSIVFQTFNPVIYPLDAVYNGSIYIRDTPWPLQYRGPWPQVCNKSCERTLIVATWNLAQVFPFLIKKLSSLAQIFWLCVVKVGQSDYMVLVSKCSLFCFRKHWSYLIWNQTRRLRWTHTS